MSNPRGALPYAGAIPHVIANGIRIEYETLGDPGRPPLVLIMGLGGQMTTWPDQFCRQLVDRGFHVVRFDNRDAGLSTKLEGGILPDVVAAYFGDASTAPYTLDDMAEDTVGLLDALGIGAAHVVGASMGGMIAQVLAIRHPGRVLSLCSMMATTGDRSVGQPRAETLAMLMQPAATSPGDVVEAASAARRVLDWSGAGADEQVRRAANQLYDPVFFPDGVVRQLCAILASEDRTSALAKVTAPTLVVHGIEDPLITASGGDATARAVPGAKLMMVEGLGHELPPDLWPRLVDEIAGNAARADHRLAPSHP